MRYLSTFSGIGGFELGIQLAYESNNEHARISAESESQERSQGWVRATDKHEVQLHTRNRPAPLCVGYSEIDKYATAIYQKHFPEHKNYGDITKIVAEELPDFDLLVGGFPCQAFSIAGKRGGFEDTRGTMFFELARILRAKQPRLFVFENVKGLLSHDGGKSFATIIQTLDELGYDLQWQVLNSKNHGVPQNRERVFIIGHLRGTPRPEVFPFGSTDEKDTRNVGEDLSYALDASYAKGTNTLEKNRRQLVQLNKPKHSNDRVYGADGLSPTINTMQEGNRQPFVASNQNLNDMVSYSNGKESKLDDGTLESEEELRKKIWDLFEVWSREEDRYSPQELGLARQSYRELGGDVSKLPLPGTQSYKNLWSEDLYTKEEETRLLREAQPEIREIWQSFNVQKKSTQSDYRIRRLSPVECERLQGFPDGWTEGVSDTQRYKTLGNAVTVNVIRDIFLRML
jgi:DNA (cytosine-5)-methyltransferase 1